VTRELVTWELVTHELVTHNRREVNCLYEYDPINII